jgi:hypothetical protein
LAFRNLQAQHDGNTASIWNYEVLRYFT